MELKMYTPVGSKFFFEKTEFKFLHYIQHDFIRQHPGLRLACSKALLLIKYFDRRSEILFRTHSNGYITGHRFSFFYKCMCGKCSLEIKVFIKLS